jgi:DinB superfamily
MTKSPAWQLDEWNLDSDLAKISQQWSVIREVLQDPVLFDVRSDSVSAWSCGEQVGHLLMVTHWVAAGIEGNLDDPTRDADGEREERAEAILVEGSFPRGVAQAPPDVDTLNKPREPFLSVLADSERRWSAIADQREKLPECQARFRHFLLGYFTSTDWVRFCALHTAHHLALVRDIRRVEGPASRRT